MGRFSEAKKLEAVEAVKGGQAAEDVAKKYGVKKYGVKKETLEAWTGKPKLKVVRSAKVKASAGRVRLPRAKAGLTKRGEAFLAATREDISSHVTARAMAVMYKSGLPWGAFREALALLEG